MKPEDTESNHQAATGPEPEAPAQPAGPPAAPRYKIWIFGVDPRKTLLRLGAWFIAVVLLFDLLLVPMTVVGTSMEPTYQDREVNFINRWPYSSHPPNRGDVVAIQISPNVMYLKRIVGLPGETVSIRGGRLGINGQGLDETYVRSLIPTPRRRRFIPLNVDLPGYHLKSDEYFVIGDNRAVTVFGTIKGSQIVGKAVF
jgi:signal peptidase I